MTSTVISSVFVFFFVWFMLRILGKRELSQLSAFDFVILIVLGDLIAEAAIGEDTSVTGAIVASATFALLTVFISWLSFRFPRTEKVLEGNPSIVILDGKILDHVLAAERLTMPDVREAARQNGVRNLHDVELAVLEIDGSFSFFTRQQT